MKARSIVPWQRMLAIVACAASLGSCSGGGDSAPAPTLPPGAAVRSISLVTGDIGGPGYLDGVAAAARFRKPAGVAVDAAGTAYVVDAGNQNIRQVSASGNVSLLAGVATAVGANFRHPQRDGDRSVASFTFPTGIALDATRGFLYVTDDDRVRRVTPGGTVSTLPPLPSDSLSPALAIAVTVAPDGTPLVAAGYRPGRVDLSCCQATVLYRLPEGGPVQLLAGSAAATGSADGQGAAARFVSIDSIATDRAGTVYVADATRLRKVTPDGYVTTLAGSDEGGFADGAATQARFGSPMGLTIDADGSVLVADAANRSIRRVTPQGAVSTLYRDQPLSLSESVRPGIAVDAGGRILYTAQHGVFSAENPSRIVAGTGPVSRDSLLSGYDHSISVDSRGNILKSSSGGTLTRIAPSGAVVGFAGGGGAAALQIPPPDFGSFSGGQAIDAADNVYQLYGLLNKNSGGFYGYSILRITPSGDISTRARTYSEAAGLAADALGSVYFIDYGFGEPPAIRKLTPAGDTVRVATLTGDLPFTFNLAVDRTGTTFFFSSLSCALFRIDGKGTSSLFAGQRNQCASVDGKGAQAQFLEPGAPVVDSAGNVYVADRTTIRRITPDGTVTTIAGRPGVDGTTLGALPGTLATIRRYGLAIDRDDNLYVMAGYALLKINAR